MRDWSTNPDHYQPIFDALKASEISPAAFIWYYFAHPPRITPPTLDVPEPPADPITSARKRLFSDRWGSTVRILQAIFQNCGTGAHEGRAQFLREEAGKIMLRHARTTASNHVAPKEITAAYFTDQASEERAREASESHPFLWNLIHDLLDCRPRQIHDEEEDLGEESGSESGDEIMDVDEESKEDAAVRRKAEKRRAKLARRQKESVKFVRQTCFPSEASAEFDWVCAQISDTVIGQIKFAFNQLDRGPALEQGMMLMACGISERAQEYLQDCALSVSRKTIDATCLGLAKAQDDKLKARVADGDPFALTLDNLDLIDPRGEEQKEKTNKDHHSSYGYVHFYPKSDAPAFDMKTFREHREETHSTPVAASLFSVTPEAGASFRAGAKATMYRGLAKLAPWLGIRLGDARCAPPPVEQLPAEIPDVHVLHLMDESDNSVESLGQMLDATAEQMGISPELWALILRIIECDAGTEALVEGLRRERFPSTRGADGIESVMGVIGGSHLEWVIGAAILRRYYGEKSDGQGYTGTLWKLSMALGRSGFNTAKIKDFNKMELLLRDVASVSLLDCLLKVLDCEKIDDIPLDISREDLDAAVEKVLVRFLSAQALQKAKAASETSPAFYESLLRLRDLVDYEEGVRAKEDGDIGRVVHFWERMTPLILGANGVRHYRTHLLHLLLELKSDSPPLLRNLLRRGMLISPSGRPHKFCFKDFYLETLNYWLAYFFGGKGAGLKYERCRDYISANILMFRDLMYKMKRVTGRAVVMRNHSSVMKRSTLDAIMLEMAKTNVHVACDTSADWERKVEDVRTLGAKKILSFKPAQLARLRYGPGGFVDMVEEEEGPEDDAIVFVRGRDDDQPDVF
ncbi:hypothetical protein P7C70_g6125, partial [Phenoliferia sp. Uapishka_3]